MASVNEQIVREYFETPGFFAIQPNKHQVAARHKHDAEEIDLLVARPGSAGVLTPPKAMIWSREEWAKVQRAVVSIRGWHTDRFTPAILKKNPKIFSFTKLSVTKEARKLMGPRSITQMLYLCDLAASALPQEEALALMRENGIDGVLSFRTMLLDLIDHLDVSKNYEKSDLIQTLRILKTCDLLKDSQPELFATRKRKRQAGEKVSTGGTIFRKDL